MMNKWFGIFAWGIGGVLIAAGAARHFTGSDEDRFVYVTIVTMAGALCWALAYLFTGPFRKTGESDTRRPIFLRR